MIFYEKAKQQSDSLVVLFSMNDEQQFKFFENYLTKQDSKKKVVDQDFGSQNSFDFKPIKESAVFIFITPIRLLTERPTLKTTGEIENYKTIGDGLLSKRKNQSKVVFQNQLWQI